MLIIVSSQTCFIEADVDYSDNIIAESVSIAENIWVKSFLVDIEYMDDEGRNPYFILEPGYYLNLEGLEEGKETSLYILVTDDTELVDDAMTRIVEERKYIDGNCVRITKKFCAIDTRTNSVYIFGEQVDEYHAGEITGHEGSWRSGENGATFGLLMPGLVIKGSRFFTAYAPGNVMNRAEIISNDVIIELLNETLHHCVKTEETSALYPVTKMTKYYAVNFGLFMLDDLLMTGYGYVK
ncbi:hypothetical protein JXA84_04140 [candidate division WOR-3 bacterium]|nr:hypothetical protein [candidate division WOR-3 bacterium]